MTELGDGEHHGEQAADGQDDFALLDVEREVAQDGGEKGDGTGETDEQVEDRASKTCDDGHGDLTSLGDGVAGDEIADAVAGALAAGALDDGHERHVVVRLEVRLDDHVAVPGGEQAVRVAVAAVHGHLDFLGDAEIPSFVLSLEH